MGGLTTHITFEIFFKYEFGGIALSTEKKEPLLSNFNQFSETQSGCSPLIGIIGRFHTTALSAKDEALGENVGFLE